MEENKSKTEQIKKMNDEIMAVYRQNEKDKVGEVRKEDEKGKLAAKLKEEGADSKEKEIQSQIKAEELELLGDVNPLLPPIESENVQMKKRLMLN